MDSIKRFPSRTKVIEGVSDKKSVAGSGGGDNDSSSKEVSGKPISTYVALKSSSKTGVAARTPSDVVAYCQPPPCFCRIRRLLCTALALLPAVTWNFDRAKAMAPNPIAVLSSLDHERISDRDSCMSNTVTKKGRTSSREDDEDECIVVRDAIAGIAVMVNSTGF